MNRNVNNFVRSSVTPNNFGQRCFERLRFSFTESSVTMESILAWIIRWSNSSVTDVKVPVRIRAPTFGSWTATASWIASSELSGASKTSLSKSSGTAAQTWRINAEFWTRIFDRRTFDRGTSERRIFNQRTFARLPQSGELSPARARNLTFCKGPARFWKIERFYRFTILNDFSTWKLLLGPKLSESSLEKQLRRWFSIFPPHSISIPSVFITIGIQYRNDIKVIFL